jgi:hypothetical protein
MTKDVMDITFTQSAESVDAYDFVEVAIHVAGDLPANPFTNVEVRGVFAPVGGPALTVDGFCDSADGSVQRVRFMPMQSGDHIFTVTYRHGATVAVHNGRFTAQNAGANGLVRVDPQHPFHFVYAGTGAHYFYNSTTAYALAGVRDDLMLAAIDRLAGLKINRLRCAIYGARVPSGEVWGEPVYNSDEFQFLMNPWPAARPDSVDDPGFDVTRFNVTHWQKFERLLRHARAHGVQVSVIFYVDGQRPPTMYPFIGSGAGPDEQRYYRYAAARFAAFSNAMWDVSNEYRLFRDDAWAETMGAFLKSCDPYDHLISVHGHGDFRFRVSAWADYALYQSWDEHGGYTYMVKNRAEQAATGRPMPQVNEEYGYEDHYPQGWGEARQAPARNADNRRRLAWEIAMAGGYQTTGEYAGNGLGGWINGRGDEGMTMLRGNAHMLDFFTSFDWWKLAPHPELADGAMCLAEPGVRAVVYLPHGGSVTLTLDGPATARWFNPRDGAWQDAVADGNAWTAPDANDWALLIQKS